MTVKQLVFLVLGLTLATAAGFFIFWRWEQRSDLARLSQNEAEPTGSIGEDESLFPSGDVTPRPQPSPGPNELGPSTPAQDRGGELLPRQQITLSVFTKIVSRAVAGAFAPQTSDYLLVFADRATGHIYALGPEPETLVRLTNTTVPKIYEFSGGAINQEIRVINRYVRNGREQNFIGGFALATSSDGFNQDLEPATLTGQVLLATVSDLTIAPDQKRLFYLEKTVNGSRGLITDFSLKSPQEIFSSPLSEWRSVWATTSVITLQTKPASLAVGSLYWLNLRNKNPEPEPVLTGLNGLSTLTSPALDYVLYSVSRGLNLESGLWHVANKAFERLPIQILPDKCVWSKTGKRLYCAAPADWPAGNYPDDWYRGRLTTADRFWEIDIPEKKARLLFDPKLGGLSQEIDAANLILDRGENYLFLINQNDLSLWALNLKQAF